MENKLMKCWQGPFEITRQVGPIDYKVLKPGSRRERQIYQVNLLKEWREQEGLLVTPSPPEDKFSQELGSREVLETDDLIVPVRSQLDLQ